MSHILKTLILVTVLFGVPAAAGAASPSSSSPDAFITTKTKLALWTTTGVKSSAVHVDTSDGIVTLYGKVPTEAERTRAEKATAEVSGVKSVKNLLQIVPSREESATAKSDKELKELAEQQLKAEPSLGDSRISVKSVDNGVALLSGDAKTYSDYLKAIARVDRVPGIKRIASEVKMPSDFTEDERVAFGRKEAMKSGASDTRVSLEVKMRLLTAADVPSTEISVDTDDGVVTLFGIVPSAEVKKIAEGQATKVSGVKRVENLLEVVPSTQKKIVEVKDTEIQKDLSQAFKQRPELKEVTTSVKNGTVRLTGTTQTMWDQLNALRLARFMPGVRGVENQTKVEKSETTAPARY